MVPLRGSTLIALIVTLASGCGVSIRAGADYTPGIDLARYDSFSWGEPDELPTGDPRLDHNPFFEDRLHRAIEDELSWRGIGFSATGADLLVHHHVSVNNRVQVYDTDQMAGYSSTDYPAGPEVFEYEEGTFLVDIADAETKEILWRGWAVADVDAALVDPDQMTELLKESVKKMFEEFPFSANGGT